MLVHLRIENYALIRHLSIPFNEGFTVITGETGAGKSILLGALSLILGQRADTQVLMDKSKKCFVEGTFKITGYDLNSFFEQNDLDYEDTLIIRREINSAGKSRAFINDTPVTLSQLKEISEKLVDIHSQHETVELNTYSFQMDLVDDFAGNQQLLKEYKLHFREYMALKALLSALREKEKQSKTDQDYYAFLLNELNEAHLVIGEQTALETELDLLTHSETIKTSLFAASQILQSSEENVTGKLNEVASVLKNIARLHPEIESYLIRIQESIVELKDVASDIEKLHEKVNFDQERIEQINQRLQLIFHLEQKHRVANPDELIKMQEKIAARLNAISHLDTEIAESENIFFTLEKQLFTLANQIVQSRNSVKKPMETAIVSVLNELGMPDSRFSVDQQVGDELTGNGIDKIRFLFTANKGGEMREISKVASGGELSRLMLALKSKVSQRKLLPTIIFDEIDIGISGEIAARMGTILQRMATRMQVIAITHLPQIAGKSENHYYVYKEIENNTTNSAIKILNNKERIVEIAKMLSSELVTESAMKTAKELMQN